MTIERLREILGRMRDLSVAAVGDSCLDAYWYADMRESELSRETPHYNRPVTRERYGPGGLGNVAANLAALGVGNVTVFSIVGDDWRGRTLISCLETQDVDASQIVSDGARFTPTYIKPFLVGIESSQEAERIDFVNIAPPEQGSVETLCHRLESALESLDGVLVADQVPHGVVTETLIQRLTALAQEKREVVFTVDSRLRIDRFVGLVWKPNELEAIQAVGGKDTMPRNELAQCLLCKGARAVFMTLGEEGCLVADGQDVLRVGAFPAPPPVDFVGAGDSFHAGMAAALASGATSAEAAVVGNLAASVTVRKLGMTGTASPSEILEVFRQGGT